MKTKPQDFRELVCKAMKDQNVSAPELAHRVYPIDRTTVERYLRGDTDTASAKVAAMFAALGLKVVQRKRQTRE